MDLFDEINKHAEVLAVNNFDAIYRAMACDNCSRALLLSLITSAMTIGASIAAMKMGISITKPDFAGEPLLSSEQELANEDRWRHEEHVKDAHRTEGSTPSA